MTDYNKKTEFSFYGEAQFNPVTSGWVYHEEGFLYGPGEKLHASRRYLYKQSTTDHILNIHFEDGRFFYSIDCKQLPKVSFSHLCVEDSYFGNMLLGEDVWSINWQIIGPRKNLLIHSAYNLAN